jgi:hypothetical protein
MAFHGMVLTSSSVPEVVVEEVASEVVVDLPTALSHEAVRKLLELSFP